MLEQVRLLIGVVSDALNDMDRAGGDGHGMPECPWCHHQGDDWEQHAGDCELISAREALAAINALVREPTQEQP